MYSLLIIASTTLTMIACLWLIKICFATCLTFEPRRRGPAAGINSMKPAVGAQLTTPAPFAGRQGAPCDVDASATWLQFQIQPTTTMDRNGHNYQGARTDTGNGKFLDACNSETTLSRTNPRKSTGMQVELTDEQIGEPTPYWLDERNLNGRH